VPCDPFREAKERRLDAEKAAGLVRKTWGLPRGPLDHVIATIEDHGIVCARLRFREERVDAFSVNFSDHPIAVLASDKDKWDRSRFDAAHELGHIVMHAEAAGVPEAERQANEFAAAFLMPARDIRDRLPERPDWGRLMELKAEWGTSIASLLMRARTLEVMGERTYVGAAKVMSARGWRRHEPVDRDPELPSMLSKAMRRASRRGLDAEALRSEAVIPRDLFGVVCDLVDCGS
jgi:Zn-dependent peptidase ImmA (M78 family)